MLPDDPPHTNTVLITLREYAAVLQQDMADELTNLPPSDGSRGSRRGIAHGGAGVRPIRDWEE